MLVSRTLINYARGNYSSLPTRNCLRSFYDWKTRKETIFAPATAIQPNLGSPLGIIRLSGPKTSEAIESLTNLNVATTSSCDAARNHGNEVKNKILKPRYAKLAKIYDPFGGEDNINSNELIDIGLLLWFPRPHSYTGEDVCELHVHGSQAILNRLLLTLGKMDGLRPAEPGEFTFRAVQNGKMDLLQAESLSELISSKTDQQRKLALKGLTGSIRKKYEIWTEILVGILAHLEASIDFGEDELLGEQRVVSECIEKLQNLSNEIGNFITVSSECRDLMQNGARVAILGRPNAGKSTFMNILCRQEKSIVSDLSGTTRDVIEHSFELGGHIITLSDTAGLKDLSSFRILEDERTTDDDIESVISQHNSIEREGIRRALQEAAKAHLLVYIVDGSELGEEKHQLDDIIEQLNSISFVNLEEKERMEENASSRALHLVINKIDLNEHFSKTITVDSSIYEKRLSDSVLEHPIARKLSIDHVYTTMISCRTQENLNILIERISSSLNMLQANLRKETTITEGQQSSLSSIQNDNYNKNQYENNNSIETDYVNERHLSLLRSVQRHLFRAIQLDIRTIDEMAQHVRESVDYLSRIVGTVENEQVLDIIFKDFCIGK